MPSRVVVDDDEQIIADLLKQQRTLQGRQATTSVHGTHDEFTVAATPETTFQLTYIPVDGTCAMYVNGLEQEEGTDYTVDYDTTSATVGEVTFVTGLTTGDRIDFRYLITDWLVARSLPAEVDLLVVQSAIGYVRDYSAGEGSPPESMNLTVTLSSAPTPGNYLIAFVAHYYLRTMSEASVDGDPWTEYDSYTFGGGENTIRSYGREVLAGDGPDITFTENDRGSMVAVIVEIAGSDNNPSGWSFANASEVATVQTVSQTVTLPDGQLALVFGMGGGGTDGVTTITPSGYTQDQVETADSTAAPYGNRSGTFGHANADGTAKTFASTWDGSLYQYGQVVVGVVPSP